MWSGLCWGCSTPQGSSAPFSSWDENTYSTVNSSRTTDSIRLLVPQLGLRLISTSHRRGICGYLGFRRQGPNSWSYAETSMRIEWHVTEEDQACVRAIISAQSDNPLVSDRRKRNLVDGKDKVTKQRLWRAMVCMRLTTQVRSGPEGKLATFSDPMRFPLAYEVACEQITREDFFLKTLRAHGVGRHQPTIAKQFATNLDRLERGGWQNLLDQCNRLTCLEQRDTEAEVADFVDKTLKGFGPKQARNVLQVVGLTRYEIPIDSRVTEWLNKTLRFPFHVTSAAFGDTHYYRLVSDAINQLCESCGEFPCVLDAAIFASKDRVPWCEDQLHY
jgi:hypothetical protein